ncbi:hypothetical protein [Natronomonas sp. EA1]|uniref:hypothetical protein n=1 Tax=Natronomonas sp. EA1 TaxID=3421655 RepID=UPI003EB91888
MNVDTIRVRGEKTESARSSADGPSADGPSADGPSADGPSADGPTRTVVEVSEVDTVRAAAYARESAARGHPEVYFERKGGRTFLVGN